MEKYIGVKVVEAKPEVKDGKEGYEVKYENGYYSWSPKDVFEKAYKLVEEEDFSIIYYNYANNEWDFLEVEFDDVNIEE